MTPSFCTQHSYLTKCNKQTKAVPHWCQSFVESFMIKWSLFEQIIGQAERLGMTSLELWQLPQTVYLIKIILKNVNHFFVCSFTCLKKLNTNARVQKQGSHNCNQYHRMTHPHTWSSRLFTDSHLSVISILHMHTHMHMWCIKLCMLTTALASYFWRQNATKYQKCPLFSLSLVLTTSVQNSIFSTVASSLM